jgi:hypoxanthine phosphoribosyltransferase
LLTEDEIRQRVAGMAAEISADYAGSERFYLVGILKGAFIFMADLARALTIPHTVDFMAVSSYDRKGAVSGELRLIMDLREPLEGADVLIVEDIVDSGKTLHYLVEILRSRGPASLRTCAFVQKRREHTLYPVDYLGFQIPDVWVVGYGLDFAERYRTLPYVAELLKDE